MSRRVYVTGSQRWLVSRVRLPWRVGAHYSIHVYEGDRPVATFHRPEDASEAVEAVNQRREVNK